MRVKVDADLAEKTVIAICSDTDVTAQEREKRLIAIVAELSKRIVYLEENIQVAERNFGALIHTLEKRGILIVEK